MAVLAFFVFIVPLIAGLDVCDDIPTSDPTDSLSYPTVDVVVASLGAPNLDGDPEDLTWIPSNLLKPLFLFDRTNTSSPFYINTTKGNECLTYTRYIIDHYHQLPSATIFIHADASRHCPFITNVLMKSNLEIMNALSNPLNPIPGYLSLSKVFLNQSYSFLKRFNLGILELSNEILTMRCEYHTRRHPTATTESLSPCNIPQSTDFPEYTTTYTSGSFIVSREKILSNPLSFYQRLYDTLYHGQQGIDTTCGALEYVWTTLWGAVPWNVQPFTANQWCGPLYYADISSNSGFMFYKSDDGSVEDGYLPDRYFGVIYDRERNIISPGKHRFVHEETRRGQ